MAMIRRLGPIASRGWIVIAVLLLAGVLAIAHGYFRQSTIALYAGLFVVICGVVAGVVSIVTCGGQEKARP